MSTMTFGQPWLETMSIEPSRPTVAVTMLAMVCPRSKLRFEAVGRAAPLGHTVRNPAAEGSVTVTFSATADASAGIPRPAPATTRDRATEPTQGPLMRVSSARSGWMPTRPPGAAGPAVEYPAMSTMTFGQPWLVKRSMAPPLPSFTVTMLGMVCPARKFRFEASGRARPEGQATRYPGALPSVTVTVRATATASAGMPLVPLMRRVWVLPSTQRPV